LRINSSQYVRDPAESQARVASVLMNRLSNLLSKVLTSSLLQFAIAP